MFSFLFFGFFIYRYIKQFRNNKPQLILSGKGIETIKLELIAWKDITNERIKIELGNKGTQLNYLEFDHVYGSEKIPIDGLTLDARTIEGLVYDYRTEYEQSTTANMWQLRNGG